MLYWNIGKSKDQEITWLILLNAIKRNFGGLEGCDPVKIFRNSMNHLPHALKRDMEEVVIFVSTLQFLILFIAALLIIW